MCSAVIQTTSRGHEPDISRRPGALSSGLLGCLCSLLLGASIPYLCISIAFAQSQESASIRVKSNLVLVPAFVYDKRHLATPPSSACISYNDQLFRSLAATQPFLPKDCDEAEIRGLTIKDFQLFENGIEQKVQSISVQSWRIVVRDSMGMHREFSQAPLGKWSTPDLDPSFWATSDSMFYMLSYGPRQSEVSGCQSIDIKVDRPHVVVLARPQYCPGQTVSDSLMGTSLGTQLEKDLASPKHGKIPLSIQTGYFRSSGTRTRVEIVLNFPWNRLHWKATGGNVRVSIGALGLLYKEGLLVERFSGLGCCSPNFANYYQDYSNEDYTSFGGILPGRYETQIDSPSGDYELKVALDDGEEFGRVELPLKIEPYNDKHISLSSVFLCKRYRDAHAAAVERATANFVPQYVPLVSKGIEFTPAGDTRFKKGEPLIAYFEIYEPSLKTKPDTKVEAHVKVLDAKSGKTVKDYPPVDATGYENAGSTTIPVARAIPFGEFEKGNYLLEVQASDSARESTEWQTANFTVE